MHSTRQPPPPDVGVVSMSNLVRESGCGSRRNRGRVLLCGLLAAVGLLPTTRISAQTFTLLHSFVSKSDGANPAAGLLLSGQTLYGTTRLGGRFGHGSVYAVNTDGTGFTNVHDFSGLTYNLVVGTDTNDDGAYPLSDLVSSGETLYGTASLGGRLGVGTVFAINTNGAGFRTVYHLTGYPSDASTPLAGLVLSGGKLYGTTRQGGSLDVGALFGVNTNGTGPATLYSFSGPDGCHLTAGLALSDTVLYGTTRDGGPLNQGAVFKINLDGSGFATLHSFDDLGMRDGSYPSARLVAVDNVLYGVTERGGSTGSGTLFKLNRDGSGFTNLHHFTSVPASGTRTNTDGAYPSAGLVLSGTILYGTAKSGGTSGLGTLFRVNVDGTGFAVLHNFVGGPGDGANPRGGLTFANNTLYGTTESGGSAGKGTVFSLELGTVTMTQPSISCTGTNVVLRWSTNLAGFTLQSSSNLFEPRVWITVPAVPAVSGDQNVVTDTISAAQQFYRLSP